MKNGQVSISPYLEVDPATPYGPTDPHLLCTVKVVVIIV